MRRPRLINLWIVIVLVTTGLTTAPAAAAQPSAERSFAGSWRGNAAGPDGETGTVVMTIVEADGGYRGVVAGFQPGREVSLSTVAVDGQQLTAEASADSDLGEITVRYELALNEDGDMATGSQRISVGGQSIALDVELNRRRRRDVAQPQVEQRVGYFVGTWAFDYTGGEFPPLSIGTRTGRVTFTQRGDAPFIDAAVTGDVYGEAFESQMVIGYDAQNQFLVFKETLSNGVELLSVANWQSPIAINFVTSPVDADGQTYQLRRVLSVTSETAFRVTEEYSVDGGPYRRLGNADYRRVH